MVFLGFERRWWTYAKDKNDAIMAALDMKPADYYDALRTVISTDAALDYDRMVTIRLRRMDAMGRLA